MIATARAHTNIALVKYWGKRDERLFLPTNSSLSLTLDGLFTTTTVDFQAGLEADRFVLDGREVEGSDCRKVSRFLDMVRSLAGLDRSAVVTSKNDVPTAAGLASSASGFAALAAAASWAAGLDLDPAALSRLARQGSGSASRSIFGGFAEWRMGEAPDGSDSHGVQVASADHWDVRMVVAALSLGRKDVASREGMRRTVETSALYPGWLATVKQDLAAVRRAIEGRDFEALGATAEANALRMHATTLGASPPFTYWQPATIALMQAVWDLRAGGVSAYFTIDAGPNVKVLCLPQDQAAVEAAIRAVPGVSAVIACGPGPGVRRLDP